MADENKKRSILDALEQGEQADPGGGGGLIGAVLTQIGWKVFVAGLSNEESFFPYDPFDAESRAAALVEAKSVLPAGANRPNSAIQFTMFKASVLNKEVDTWKGDRIFTIPQWTDNYKKIVKPAVAALVEQGQDLEIGKEQWMRISFKPDASTPQRAKPNYKFNENEPEDPVKNPRMVVELIAYPAQIYADKAEAEAAVGQEQVADADLPSDPFELVKGDADFLKDVKTALKQPVKKQEAALLAVAADYISQDESVQRASLDKMRALAS